MYGESGTGNLWERRGGESEGCLALKCVNTGLDVTVAFPFWLGTAV